MSQNIAGKAHLIDIAKITEQPRYVIGKPVFSIGRSPKNDVVIPKKTISGRHAAIAHKADGYYVVDLGSTNKTQLNGTELIPNKGHRLKDGDEICVDAYTFIFRLETVDQRPAPPPTAPPESRPNPAAASAPPAGQPSGAPPASSPAPQPESDETVFFDTGEMMGGIAEQAAPEPAAGREAPTLSRPEPQETGEIKYIGTYEVEKLLGKGGFGSVWKAKNKEGEPIAIKVLNPDVLENERAVRKFFHEAIILSRLDHPNICRFIDFFPHEENYAIVMDYVEGTDLKVMLEEKKGPLPLEQARKIAAESLDAFHYAHLQNVLHRDIKPENITIDRDGVAKVMDFGIAKLSSSESHQTSLFMISPAYTAPERFDAKKTELVDHRSDIYSLGLVFYELFTGTHPFPTTNPTEMIISHINKVPTAPSDMADVPSDISAAIMTALEKDPDERFEDFGAFKITMLGEVPRMSGGLSKTVGALSFAGEHAKEGAKILRTLSDIIKKHQKNSRKITLAQDGNEIHLIIETLGGNAIRITKDIDSIVNQRISLF